MPKDGWIKIHRKLRDNEVWNSKKPFDKRSAWIDLLLRATHKEEKFLLGNTKIELKAGQIFTSEKKLAEDWKWSRHKVRNFLETLNQIGQIGTPKRTSKYTIITITNWSLYQSGNSEKDIKKNINGTSTGHIQECKECKEIRSIVELMNKILDTSFKPTTTITQKLIKGRLSEGYSIQDFKRVIEYKKKDWENTEQEKYLRPQTLFRPSNFESYLQQAKKAGEKKKGRIL